MTDAMSGDTFAKLFDLLDSYSRSLAHNLRTGYIEGYERELADDLIFQLTLDERKTMLDYLTRDEAMSYPIAGGLLDECDDRTYDAANRVADIWLDAIAKQGSAGVALGHLVMSHLCLMAKVVADPGDPGPSGDAMTVTFD